MIQFVSLVPGDPELITLKGLRALQKADAIYCPTTVTKLPDGEVRYASRAAEIVKALEIDHERVRSLLIPMSRDRSEAQRVYDQFVAELCKPAHRHLQIVVAAEGDVGFYSSVHYLMDQLREQEVEVEQIAGVPAFIAAGARAKLHIVKQKERLMVIPGDTTASDLMKWVEEEYTVVVMKLNACQSAVQHCMEHHPNYSYSYFENLGMPQERCITDVGSLSSMTYPYFSLMIIRK